jgi:hypothetical protein
MTAISPGSFAVDDALLLTPESRDQNAQVDPAAGDVAFVVGSAASVVGVVS